MTDKAKLFVHANRNSPVVYGSVIAAKRHRGEGPPPALGCYYRLANGKTFKLGVRDVRALPAAPRWAFDEA
jgi:hypothetical protein